MLVRKTAARGGKVVRNDNEVPPLRAACALVSAVALVWGARPEVCGSLPVLRHVTSHLGFHARRQSGAPLVAIRPRRITDVRVVFLVVLFVAWWPCPRWSSTTSRRRTQKGFYATCST